MDDLRTGRALRALRLRRRLRQADVAAASGVAQSTVSRIERGHLADLSIRTLRDVFATVDARLEAQVGWRGGALDRLLDEGHAALVGRVTEELTRRSWVLEVEATFSHYGERGSIDILAGHESRHVVLVVEVKTELTSIEETLRRLDVKTRLAVGIATERFGWRPTDVSRMLVLPDRSAPRRRVVRQAAVLGAAFPARGRAIRVWLADPEGHLSGLQFLADSSPRDAGRARKSVGSTPKHGVSVQRQPLSPRGDI